MLAGPWLACAFVGGHGSEKFLFVFRPCFGRKGNLRGKREGGGGRGGGGEGELDLLPFFLFGGGPKKPSFSPKKEEGGAVGKIKKIPKET